MREERATVGGTARPARSGLATASLALGVLSAFSFGLTAPVGLILAIVALHQIRKSGGRLTGKGIALAGICVNAVMFFVLIPLMVWVVLPDVVKAHASVHRARCISQVQRLAEALRSHASENSGDFPSASRWCDAIMPRVGSAIFFTCPAHPKQPASYAINARLRGLNMERADGKTVLIFEANAGWNAAGGPELTLKGGRKSGHGSQPRKYTVALADGTVTQVTLDELKALRWEP